MPSLVATTPSLTIREQAELLFSADRRRVRDFLPTLPQATRLLNQAVRVYNAAEARGQRSEAMTRLRKLIEDGFNALADINEALDASTEQLAARGARIEWRSEESGLGRISPAVGYWTIAGGVAAIIAASFAAPFIAACLALAGLVSVLAGAAALVGTVADPLFNPTDQDGKPRTSGLIGFGTLAVIGLGLWIFAGRKRGAA